MAAIMKQNKFGYKIFHQFSKPIIRGGFFSGFFCEFSRFTEKKNALALF